MNSSTLIFVIAFLSLFSYWFAIRRAVVVAGGRAKIKKVNFVASTIWSFDGLLVWYTVVNFFIVMGYFLKLFIISYTIKTVNSIGQCIYFI